MTWYYGDTLHMTMHNYTVYLGLCIPIHAYSIFAGFLFSSRYNSTRRRHTRIRFGTLFGPLFGPLFGGQRENLAPYLMIAAPRNVKTGDIAPRHLRPGDIALPFIIHSSCSLAILWPPLYIPTYLGSLSFHQTRFDGREDHHRTSPLLF